MRPLNRTVDDAEIAHFTAMADEWWDANGKFKPLHRMNPLRIRYIRDQCCAHFELPQQSHAAFEGLRVLDIGSGGGLLCEPLARMGAAVTGVDAAEKNIRIATLHAAQMGLDIDYRHTTAEALAAAGEQYDVVTALEIVEHVADTEAFIAAISTLVRPGGLIFMSTLNRTAKSYLAAIIGAEYVLRWVPRGTHHWRKFLRPSELILPLERHGIRVTDVQGMLYHPVNGDWSLSRESLDINYILCGKKA